jgi:Asp-tRNA(Asn)/Glu-tRNA(Gln) amidotransferase A subunit family amidase
MGVFLDYYNFWSLLHYPAGVVPVGRVEEGEDAGYTDTFNDSWTRKIKDDIEGTVGLPLSVTIAALPYQDEIAIGIMENLEKELAFRMKPSI